MFNGLAALFCCSVGDDVIPCLNMQAKLRYAHEKAVLGVRVGLHASPDVNMSAMVGTGFGLHGGFSLAFSTKSGLVNGVDLGLNCMRNEWGNASVCASFVMDPEGKKKNLRKIRALYS